MKAYLANIIVLLSAASILCGCAKSIDDIYLDENKAPERWDGNGMPSWLADRYLYDFWVESDLMYSSHAVEELLRVHRFEHDGHFFVTLSYDVICYKFRDCKHLSGTLCYSDDGRRVDFSKVQNSFTKSSVLVSTNAWDGDNVPKLSDFKFKNIGGLGWLQEEINNICTSIREPDQILFRLDCGGYETSDYVYLNYFYYDFNDPGEEPLKSEYCMFTLNGERVEDYYWPLSFNTLYIDSGLSFLRKK